MFSITLAGLRSDWRLWVGPCIVAASTSLLVSLVVTYWMVWGTTAGASVIKSLGQSVNEVRAISYVLYVVIGLSVIVVLSSNTAMTVRAQRLHLASLRLAGARPKQIRHAVLTQVSLVSAVSSIVGWGASLPLAQTAVDILTRMATRTDARLVSSTGVEVLAVAVGANLLACMLAAIRPARTAARVPAIAAVRDEPAAEHHMGIVRWLGSTVAAFAVVIVLIGEIATVFYVSSIPEVLTAGASNAIMLGISMCATLGLLSPVFLPHLLRAWTALVPSSIPSWYFSRRSALYRFAMSSSTIVPLMVGFALVGILFGSIATWRTAIEVTGTIESLNTVDTYVVLAPVVVITGVGSIVNLFMTSRGRERELTLLRTAGATSRLIRAQVAIEALIYVVTAAVAGLLVSILTVLSQSLFYALGGGPFLPTLDLTQLGALIPVSYIRMFLVVAIPARTAQHHDLRTTLGPP